MYELKGFVSMPRLTDNRPDKTAVFGELTTQSKTFTRDIREYAKTAYPDVTLHVFKCVDEMQVSVEPTSVFIDQLLALGQWLQNQYLSKLVPTNANQPAFAKSITDEFSYISAVQFGTILTGAGPDLNLPDYVQFKMIDTTRQYQVTLWLSDAAFQSQYPDYTIFMIPPVDQLDQLTLGKVAVNNAITALPASRLINQIQNIKQHHPETALVSYELIWHDPSDTNAVLKTTWTAVCYGQQATDTDAIKEAIRVYIDQHSEDTRWASIYPDLYSENEFVFIPNWSGLAVQPNAMKVGLYQSFTNVGQMFKLLNRYLPAGYNQTDETYITNNLYIGNAFYRTLMFGALGNPNNANQQIDIAKKFPDYMAVDTQDTDFARMSKATQQWVYKLNQALDVAFKYNPTDILSVDFVRTIRKDMHFISFTFEGFSYLILTKYSFDKGAV